MTRAQRWWLAIALPVALAGCAGSGAPALRAPHVPPSPAAADSVTIGVWRFDEDGGTGAADAGPYRLDGVAGIDTHTDFGRYRGARVFRRELDSFVFVPYNPVMDPARGFTVEAWVYVNSVSPYELQVIAARWTPVPNSQSWVLGVSGAGYTPPAVPQSSPGWFQQVTGIAPPQRLVFGFQPARAGGTQGYFSTSELPLQGWVHVAASVDGEVVRLFVDGRLDSQFATTSTIRPSDAPLVVGSAFDPRRLTSFGSDLRIDPAADVTLFYQFDGSIDEVRLSSAARARFESAALH